MQCALEILGKQNDFKINAIKNVSEALFTFGTIDVYSLCHMLPEGIHG